MLIEMLVALCLPQASVESRPVEATVALKTPDVGLRGPRWSPKAASVPLKAEAENLVGGFALGHPGAAPIAVRLGKSAGAAHFDRLWIDADRDGALGDAELLQATPKDQRGKWWSSFEGSVAVPCADGKTHRPYPMSLWFVADPKEPEASPALRWTRRGWRTAVVDVDGRPAHLLVTEMVMDGVFDQRDAWAMARTIEKLELASSRTLETHVWMDGKAYRASAIDPDGKGLTFAPFDPGVSEADERAKADLQAADRKAERAEKPLQFGKDLAAALVAAEASGKRVFVDFQTTWCGPCRQMEHLVYVAKDVVDAAADCISVVLDGDEQRDLVKKYQVKGYPTMLLLDAKGVEIRREVGYRGVADMVRFFRPDPAK